MNNATFLNPNDIRVFSGSSNLALADEIARQLGVPLEPTDIRRFSNDNLYVQLGTTVRARNVYLIQSLTPPVNDHLMELFMMLDIARSASAKQVHAVIPYYSFARSDKKDAPRISITARLVADLLRTAGATNIMTMMLHSPQVHGFFSVPTDPLTSRPVFQEYFSRQDLTDTIVIAPDIGSAKSAARFAKDLGGLPVAAGNKERVSDTEVHVSGLIGAQLRGMKRALIYDDEIATGGSMLEVARILVEAGVREIQLVCTHGLFSGNSLERLGAMPEITGIVTTDTIYQPPTKRHPKLHVVSVAHVFADAIRKNYLGESISDLFVYGQGNS
ncbi:MAG: Ribose-phosphate pyrophosphokinase [Anaerolineae bacterium]|nr:Ribose-phosphate pyrophosphokinase [Anaerolineae bacterium]MDL1896007.1 ribose-phosphate pyrophosphokinase [Anaerolineae bacterium CFX7]RIK32118.1 MAG: ribose-phosphate pyrophosphokinase [Chloroflexota bacterium]